MKRKRTEREAYLENVMDEIRAQLNKLKLKQKSMVVQSIFIVFIGKWFCKIKNLMKFMIYWLSGLL